ncbi:Netrin-A [Exaiptasia diaphana]|nr:Netrin-A [Exaiptasia diaphana]
MQDRIASDGVKTSQQNQSFFLMTNLRLMLVSYVTPERFNISTATENLKRGLSFSVEDWSIQAACYCSGQASTCQNDTHCVCERNTAGRNCEKCLPLFHNRPYEIWKACQGN